MLNDFRLIITVVYGYETKMYELNLFYVMYLINLFIVICNCNNVRTENYHYILYGGIIDFQVIIPNNEVIFNTVNIRLIYIGNNNKKYIQVFNMLAY